MRTFCAMLILVSCASKAGGPTRAPEEVPIRTNEDRARDAPKTAPPLEASKPQQHPSDDAAVPCGKSGRGCHNGPKPKNVRMK